MLYDYHCNEHGYFELRRPMAECQEKGVCPDCGSECDRVYIQAPATIISETDGPYSAKPHSYWDNAERNRLKRQKEKAKVEREKRYYHEKGT